MNYYTLKNAITTVIKENGNEEITGQIMQDALIAIINALGLGFQFMGEAKPATDPGTPDARVFYVAADAGSYSHFGGVTLNGKSVAFFLWTDTWSTINLPIPTNTALSDYLAIANLATATGQGTNTAMTQKAVTDALGNKVDKVEGKGLSTNDLTDALKAKVEGALAASKVLQDLGDDAAAVISQAAMTVILAGYAKIDGYYQSLIAGAAENLVGHGSVPAEFLRRTSGGTADIGTGSAVLTAIKGRSIVWNQLTKLTGNPSPAHGLTFGIVSDIEVSVTGTCDQTGMIMTNILGVFPSVSGHKYLIKTKILSGTVPSGAWIANGYAESATNIGESKIFQPNYNSQYLYVACVRADDTFVDAHFTINFVDLTLMFGAGNEPSTVAEFEALFPLPYYAYEPGKVLPFDGHKLVTTGFNQWDEEWEDGQISSSTGQDIPSSAQIRSKNYIPIFPNTQYYFYAGTGNFDNICYYDSDKNYITTHYGGGLHTTPSNARYVRFSLNTTYGTTYKNDVCINLSWSGIRNGEYEPYEVHELEIWPAALLDVNGDPVFPNSGMHGVGTAFDSMKPEADGFIHYANRVFERYIFTGNENFAPTAGGDWVCVNILDGVAGTGSPFICSNGLVTSIVNGASYPQGVVVSGSAGSTSAEVATKMAGAELLYVLATPVVVELATPIAAQYYVNDFGTEEWQPANGSEPYTAPCNLEIQYAMNAVDTLRRLPENYISTGSFENFCTELATKLGAALNKTITITPAYNATTQEYDFTISIVDVE